MICKGIYCITDILTKALANATSQETLCRRLMAGVFIPSTILDCTVTGQSWRAGGERAALEMKPLHKGALDAIVGEVLVILLYLF